MADRAISALVPTDYMTDADLFAINQGGQAKKVTWQVFYQYLAIALAGHGGISDITYTPPASGSVDGTITITLADQTSRAFIIKNGVGISSVTKTPAVPPSLTDTYTITYDDGNSYSFEVDNGKSISSIADKWAVSDSNVTVPSAWADDPPSMTPTNKYLWHYQIITFNDATTHDTDKAVVGVYGDTGQDWHVFFKWSEEEPTRNSDMSDVPNNWIGIYSGTASTPPATYTSYTWFEYKGEKGDTGTSITEVELHSSAGLVDTYWVKFSDGTHTSFDVRNGSQIQSITKTATTGLVDTYTVLLTDGTTTTFDVSNGKGITSITEVDVTHAAGHTDVYRVNFNDGDSFTFSIYNGANGSGSVSTVDGIESQNQNVTLLIIGQGAPTPATVGVLKQRYFDQTNSILYICVGIDTSGAETTYTWQGTGVTVDSALSSMSTNPVQNRILTAIIGLATLDTTAQTLTEAVNELCGNKLDITAITTKETSTTASKAYSVGDLLILEGVLYRVTSEIASGGTIVVSGSGANVEADTIENELNELRGEIADLLIAEYDASDCSIVFRSADVASYDASDCSIIINI